MFPYSRDQLFRSPPLDNENGLVGWYRFDDGGVESSGLGGYGIAVATNPTDVGGFIGGATNINAAGGWQIVSPLVSLGSIFTLCGWVYVTGTMPTGGNEKTLFATKSSNVALTLSAITTGRWGLWTGNYRAANTTTIAGTWNFVAATNTGSGGTTTLYTNGISDGGGVAGTGTIDAATPSLPHSIGYDQVNASRNFPGYVDDFRIYNRVLSADEIFAMFCTGAAFFNLRSVNLDDCVLRAVVGVTSGEIVAAITTQPSNQNLRPRVIGY